MLLLVAFVSGCSDRLDIPKNGNMGGMDDFYQNDKEVDEALATLYVSLKSNYYNCGLSRTLSPMMLGLVEGHVVTMVRWKSSTSIVSVVNVQLLLISFKQSTFEYPVLC